MYAPVRQIRFSRSIATAERTFIGQIAVDKNRADRLEDDELVGIDQVDADEAKARVADFVGAEPRNQARLIADGVIVRGALRPAEFAHRFTGRLAEANAHPRTASLPFIGARNHHLNAAVQFAAEIQQHGRRFALVAKRASGRRVQRHLALAGLQQILRVFHRGLISRRLPNDPLGRDVFTDARSRLARPAKSA